jgi:hypothetical protein
MGLGIKCSIEDDIIYIDLSNEFVLTLIPNE